MADDINVGSVSVSVVPDATNFARLLGPQVTSVGDAIGKEIGQRISSQISESIKKGIGDGAPAAAAASARAGTTTGGAFADSFKARVTAALRDLPKPRVGLDATEVDAELADIRTRLAALGDVRVGIDIGAADALAELDALKARIDELGARSPDIAVRVDAARASEELAAVRAEVNALDGSTAHINVEADTAAAASGLSGLATAVIGLGPALVPIGAAATAGLGGIATTAAAGASGLGVLALGFSSVSNAVNLLGKEHTAAAQAAARSAATQTASAAAQVAAANQVRSATEGLSLARVTAAQQEIAAAEAVSRAQYAKTQADQQEANAQTQLNNAREQAARDLESAANQVIDSQLASRQAAIDVTNAQSNYNATLSSGTATETQRQQAVLDLAKARQALVEANERAKQAEEDNSDAQKAGVKGAPSVVAAAQAIAAARHNQVQAGQALADAERAQGIQREQSAFAVEQAERAVTAAFAAQTKAAQGAGTAGSTAMGEIKASLAKVNPVVAAFAAYVTGTLEPAFQRLKDTAAVGFIPGLEAGLKAMQPLMAPLLAFVSGLAATMGTLFKQAGQALTAPFWTQFFTYVSATAGPTLAIMAHVIGDVATGFAGLMEAFAPVVTQMGAGIAHLAAGFATFGAGAGSDSGFQGFLRYIEKVGPQVVTTIGHIVTATAHIVQALAPIGPVVLSGIKVFADIINAIPIPVITAIAVAVIAVVGALKAWAIIQVVLNALMLIWDTLTSPWLLLLAGAVVTILAIVAAVAALAFGIYELVKHWNAVWGAIKIAIEAVYNWIKANWPLLLGILAGPFGLAVAEIVKHWGTVLGFLEKMPGRIAKATVGMWDGIKIAFKATINTIIGWWDGFVSHLKIPGFTLDTHIPGVPTAKFGGLDIGGSLKIPFLAQGGVATAARLAVHGEAGDEAILPLTNPAAMAKIRDALGGGQHGGLHIGELNVSAAKDERAEVTVPRALRQYAYTAGLWDLG